MKIGPKEFESLKPFFSIFMIISALLVIVFAKMEERRLGYALLRSTREQRLVLDDVRTRELGLAKMMRPQHVERFAQDRTPLRKIQSNQIIQLSGSAPAQPSAAVQEL